MSAGRPDRRRAPLLALGVVAVLCCAAGPAVIGAIAGSSVGGWLGLVVACLLAGAAAVVLHLRARRSTSC